MKRPRWRSPDSTAVADWLDSVLTACTVVLLLASLGGLTALFSTLHIGLRVGDILVFKPQAGEGGGLPVTATRDRPGQPGSGVTCTLDPAAMEAGGGSLVVEMKSLTKPVYVVHWAGIRTSNDAANCGSSTNLTMSAMDLQSLVNAIGGFSLNSDGNVL